MEQNNLLPLLTQHGRIRQDGDCLFMNWTCSGFSVRFTGRTLKAKLRALAQSAFRLNVQRRILEHG